MNSKIFTICCLLLITIYTYKVEKKQKKTLQLIKGSTTQLFIPIFFYQFQHTIITEQPQLPDNNKLCKIARKNNDKLLQKQPLFYNQSSSKNKNNIIWNFEQLQYQDLFLDAIIYNNRIYAVFSNKKLIIFGFGGKQGALIAQYNYTLNTQKQIYSASFLIMQSCLLIFTSSGVFRAQQIKQNYFNITISNIQLQRQFNQISDLKAIKQFIYLSNQQQFYTLFYIQVDNQIIMKNHNTFRVSINSQIIQYQADQFYITAQNTIYILDQEDGLVQIQFSPLTNNTYTPKFHFLKSGCNNLIVTSFDIYLTCPELYQIDRNNKQIIRAAESSFFPFQVIYKNQRLYLFGRKQIAIYDIFGKYMFQYDLQDHSEKGLFYYNNFVSFGFQKISHFSVIPYNQAVKCYSNQNMTIGSYNIKYIAQGLCNQYTAKNIQDSGTCYVQFQLQLNITDPVKLDLTYQIIFVLIWIFFFLVVLLYIIISRCIIKHKYKELIQEDVKQQESHTGQLPELPKQNKNTQKIQQQT